MDLQNMIENFIDRWAPTQARHLRLQFTAELRELLEAYGRAALAHESLPDTEHGHGDPV